MKLSDDGKTLLKVDNNDIKKNGHFDIPQGVTSIGKDAFSNCTGLQSITLPAGITSLGDGAFFSCTRLQSIIIPPGITSIGNEAFSDCTRLQSIIIPSGVTSIRNGAFINCTRLQSIAISAGVTSIGNGAFSDCTGLQIIILPAEVTSIDFLAFANCLSLDIISITSTDDTSIQRITNLFPDHLKDKVISNDVAQAIFQIREAQLSRVAQTPQINPLYRYFNYDAHYKIIEKNGARKRRKVQLPDDIFLWLNEFSVRENPYYQQAELRILRESLPKNKEELVTYKNNLENIANESIEKVKEFIKSQNNLIESFEKQLQEIANQEKILREKGPIDDAKVVKKLYQKVKRSYENTLSTDGAQFKNECKDAIDEARPQLGKHFSFFQTDSAQKPSTLEESIDAIANALM